MKNKLTQNLLIAAIAGTALITTVDAQNRDKPGGGRQIGGQSNRGAPNSLRDRNGNRDGNANRQTVRKPYGGRERDGDNARKPEPGQGRKPGTGMGRVDKPGQNGQNGQKPKPKPNLREVLDLTDEQAKALRAARKKWRELAKSIHENKELSKEEKQAKLKEGFKKFDAAVQEILSKEQYAKLRELRRQGARPGNNQQQAGGQNQNRRKPNGADLRKRIAESLKLTDEQKKKLRAVHEHAVKKIRAIHANKELSKEEKQAEIQAIHKTAHARRKEILTDEQEARLRAIHAYLRSKRENQTQPVSTENGRPQQGGGNREKGRPQQGGGNDQAQKFPAHWGKPPAIQTRDYVRLPGNYGHGSSTLARWIEENLKRDRDRPVDKPSGTDAPAAHAKVTLYVIKGCGYCLKAASLLKSKGVDFVKKDIRQDKKAFREVKERTEKAGVNWRGGVPITAAGKHVIVGYNKSALERLAR